MEFFRKRFIIIYDCFHLNDIQIIIDDQIEIHVT